MLFRYGDFDVGFTEELDGRPEREADDVAVATLVRLDRAKVTVLYRVSARFIERIAARYRSLDLLVAVVAHLNMGDGVAEERRGATRSHHGDGGDYIVLTAAKGLKHPARLVSPGWLAENCAVEGDHRVGREDDRVGVKETGGLGLRTGEAARDDLWVAAGCCVFLNINRADFEW